MKTYARDENTWRRYQPFLSDKLRLTDNNLPTESRWAFRDLSIHIDHYENPNKRTVIVCHGGGSYGRFLAPLVRFLADAGYNVVLPDLPGYGLSEAPSSRIRYPLWVETVAELAKQEKAATGLPVVLLGMSMGGMLTVHAASAAPLGTVAAIVTTTLMDPRDPDVRAAASGSSATPLRLLSLLSWVRLPVRRLASVHAMSSIAEVNKLSEYDPMGGGNSVPIGFFLSWMQYTPPLEFEKFDRCPILLAHPAADRWTPTALSKRSLDRFTVPTRLVELPKCEHLPIEEPGVSLFQSTTLEFLEAFPNQATP